MTPEARAAHVQGTVVCEFVVTEEGRAAGVTVLSPLGNVECQFRLASTLLDLPSRPERDLVQAIAWLELAAEKGHSGAREALSRESAALTPAQAALAKKLKPQLLH